MSYTAPEDVADSTQEQHDLAAAIIDAYCKRSFGQKTEFVLDGSGTETIYVPQPIIGLTDVIAGDFHIPTAYVKFANQGRELVRLDGEVWPEGKLNVTVRGVFGVEPIPALIKEASKRLVAMIVDGSWQPGNFGQVKVGSVSFETGPADQANIIGDPTIEAMLDTFVRKIRAIPI